MMKKLFPFLAILLLMLTLAVSCQKDEITPAKNEDQVALRTLDLNKDQLQDVHDALVVAIENLYNDGTLTQKQRNYLTNLLKKLQKAIDKEDLEEANLLLEDDFLDYLEALLDDGVLDQGQFDELQAIATNQPITVTGTVTAADGVVYNWQQMADGNKWLVQNLRYADETAAWLSFYESSAYYPMELSGRYYQSWNPDPASKAFADPCPDALGTGWHLPSKQEWMDLVGSYEGEWTESGEVFKIYQNTGTYNLLVANMYGWNDSDGVGFNATLTGRRERWEEAYQHVDQIGFYLTSTSFFDMFDNQRQWVVAFNKINDPHSIAIFPMALTEAESGEGIMIFGPDNYNSCRCVHD